MSRGRTPTRRPARRPARGGGSGARRTGWKPPRRRAEVMRAVAGAVGIVLLTVLVVFAMHWLWDDGGSSPGTPGTPATTPASTPASTPSVPVSPPSSSPTPPSSAAP